ncbi:cation:proton antiporter [Spiribacter halobius]|uniref:Sodium:proton antiporter n=1 Tax=Sediminicurvatus halobius TaxID=2182432 RepID=A0A2U2N9Q9_9GAMM|nr:cation:proton antiporter [Spiribacter halobius]PWG65848.1 sodium:proton antiporter [Spiribacter halobius]UEX77894.1 cation:proton antiporter [Spiribacter halobius]
MNDADAFFGLSPTHVLMAATGGAIFLGYWLPHLLFRRTAFSSVLLMILGLIIYVFVPGMPDALDPTVSPRLWEVVSEMAVIIVLFATGLRIDDVSSWNRWRPTVRMLLIAMPLTIACVAFLGWALAGMTVAGAVLLGAVLSPTDPVLAGDVQVGPPLEGKEHPVRFTLTAEAGLNDGLAFPFVYLGLVMGTQGIDPSLWLTEWVVRDVLYRIAVGAVVGGFVGWLLGRSLFSTWGAWAMEKSGPGVLALGAVLMTYGVVELVEGYGFIGAFTAGLCCRQVQKRHSFHTRLHAFSEAIEHAITAVLLVLLGSALPALWPVLDWRHSLIGFGLLLVIRPLVGWLSLLGAGMPSGDRWIVGFFGVRGIGSIYYVGFATGHLEFINEDQIWALAAYTIFASALIHGATSFLVDRHVSR